MNGPEQLRKKILKQVKDFYFSREKRLNTGKVSITYAGRVYNQREVASLVDSSLDFWLTAGRYASKFESNLAKLLGVK